MINAATIRRAVRDLLEGKTGVVRRVPVDAFGYASFDGQSETTQEARIVIEGKRSVFDVQIKGYKNHAATPITIKASHRTVVADIQIPTWTLLRKYDQAFIRDQQRAEIEHDCDTAIQALCYPGNLTTSCDESTNIVSGMLHGPDGYGAPTWSVIEEDWPTHRLRGVIEALAIIEVPQPIA